MELVKGEFFEVSGINCSIENPSFVTAVISAAQFRFSRPWVSKINVKYVTCVSEKRMTKILQNCAFVSYASTFLHLQPSLTQFFAFFLQTRRLSRTGFSLQHFLLTINFYVNLN
jgi:hypothetical protein